MPINLSFRSDGLLYMYAPWTFKEQIIAQKWERVQMQLFWILQSHIRTRHYTDVGSIIFTGRNEVVPKIMFLHVSVILSTGGGLQAGPPSRENPPSGQGEPPWAGKPPQDQADPPDQADTPPGRRLQHTVNERPVRILLECILVEIMFFCPGRNNADWNLIIQSD